MARYYSGKNAPITQWNNIPVYLTTILTAIFVVGLIVTAVGSATNSVMLGWLVFEMPLSPAWSAWRLFTYPFVAQLSFFTPFGILMFYWWSVGIETHLGRPALGQLLLLLVLTPPIVAAIGWWVGGVPSVAYDNYVLTAGLLVAFATLYPNSEAWGWIPFKWVAFACIACGSLMLLAAHQWIQLWQLWASCGVGFAYMRHAKELEYDDYESPLAKVRFWFKRRKFRVVESGPARRAARVEPEPEDAMSAEMDRLLDKIAHKGIDSLSAKERAQLEKAREALMKRDKR